MNTDRQLRMELERIHRKSYPAYKDLKGSYQFPGYILHIDHVQGDPFAAPSKVSVEVPQKMALFPAELFNGKYQRIALQDYLNRVFAKCMSDYMFQAKGSGKSGLMSISRCGQQVLERTALEMNEKRILARFEVGFPANGRSINSPELEKILFRFVPECVKKSLYYKNLDAGKIRAVVDLAEDQQAIREELKQRNLAAFVANGSVLPRESGVSDKPMKGAVIFESPESMEVELTLPHKGKLKGMGIPKGITLIVGGGYHGKSTLLKALELGVYNHIAGDGREYVITDDTAVKIRAEDGRAVSHVNISPFINHLPNGKDTVDFSTEDASGSTSQAANVVEAVDSGAKTLLIDEDTSATNFMVRDALMQSVIAKEKEPITPFIDQAKNLYQQQGVSVILVAGSSGAYFYIADKILQMDTYQALDITEQVKKIFLWTYSGKLLWQGQLFNRQRYGRIKICGANCGQRTDHHPQSYHEICGRTVGEKSKTRNWQTLRECVPEDGKGWSRSPEQRKCAGESGGSAQTGNLCVHQPLSGVQKIGKYIEGPLGILIQ